MKIIKNNQKVKTLTSLAFILTLVLTPALGFAKDNDLKNESKNKVQTTTSCRHAFGQLLKNGWKNVDEHCRLPFGIFKKWNFIPAPKPADIIAPVINSVTVVPAMTKAEVKLEANEKVKTAVFYGTTTPIVVKATATSTGNMLNSVSSTNSQVVIDTDGLRANDSVMIKNLTASTTYYAVIAVRDAGGNVTLSNVITFTTTASNDTTAPTISNIITTISSSSVNVSWKTNELATGKLFYGTSTLNINSSSTASVSSSSLTTNHTFTLAMSASTTPYHIVLQSADAQGNVRTSGEYLISYPF